MDIVSSIIRYIQQSERLIVVTVVLSFAGVAAHFAEQMNLVNFTDLPQWARPAATLVWIVASVHVTVRIVMALGSAIRQLSSFAVAMPRRWRQSRADGHVVDRLLKMNGLAREILCYARYREDNHIWTDGRSQYHWLNRLKEAGLVELSDATFGSAHYKIHAVAWKYMQRFPDKFLHVLAWRELPWTEHLNEFEIEKRIEARQKATKNP